MINHSLTTPAAAGVRDRCRMNEHGRRGVVAGTNYLNPSIPDTQRSTAVAKRTNTSFPTKVANGTGTGIASVYSISTCYGIISVYSTASTCAGPSLDSIVVSALSNNSDV